MGKGRKNVKGLANHDRIVVQLIKVSISPFPFLLIGEEMTEPKVTETTASNDVIFSLNMGDSTFEVCLVVNDKPNGFDDGGIILERLNDASNIEVFRELIDASTAMRLVTIFRRIGK